VYRSHPAPFPTACVCACVSVAARRPSGRAGLRAARSWLTSSAASGSRCAILYRHDYIRRITIGSHWSSSSPRSGASAEGRAAPCLGRFGLFLPACPSLQGLARQLSASRGSIRPPRTAGSQTSSTLDHPHSNMPDPPAPPEIYRVDPESGSTLRLL
jgi:hypothetical protein